MDRPEDGRDDERPHHQDLGESGLVLLAPGLATVAPGTVVVVACAGRRSEALVVRYIDLIGQEGDPGWSNPRKVAIRSELAALDERLAGKGLAEPEIIRIVVLKRDETIADYALRSQFLIRRVRRGQ